MSCCGQRRAAARTPRPAPIARPTPELVRPVQVFFSGAGPIVMRGEETGLTYAFAAGSVPLAVDERDVGGLVSTGAFARAN